MKATTKREYAAFVAYHDAMGVWVALTKLCAAERRERRLEMDLWQSIVAKCAAEYRRLRGDGALF